MNFRTAFLLALFVLCFTVKSDAVHAGNDLLQPLPYAFQVENRAVFGPEHELYLATPGNADSAVRRKRALNALEVLHRRIQSLQPLGPSAELGMLRHEFLSIRAQWWSETKLNIHGGAEETYAILLQVASDRAAADYLVAVGMVLSPQYRTPDGMARLVQMLDIHRRAFGDVVRQVPIWSRMIVQAADDVAQERVLRAYLTAARQMSSERAVLDAQARLATNLLKQGKSTPELLQIAEALAPSFRNIVALDASRVREKDFQPASAGLGDPEGPIHTVRKILKLAGKREEEIELRNSALLAGAMTQSMCTDFPAFAWVYSMLLEAKFRDADLYRNGLATFMLAQHDCLPVQQGYSAEAYAASIGASGYEGLGIYPAALEFQRDAVAYLESSRAPDTIALAKEYIALGQLEWRTGSLSQAEAALRKALSLAARRTSDIEPHILGSAYLILAELADLELNDVEAAAHFQAFARHARMIDSNYHNAPVHLQGMLQTIEKVFSGRFCRTCLDEQIESLNTFLGQGATAAVQMRASGLLARILLVALKGSDTAVSPGTKAQIARAMEDFAAESMDPGMIAGIKSRIDTRNQTYGFVALCAIAAAFADACHRASLHVPQKDVFDFLLERNAERRASLARPLFERVEDSAHGQFGRDADFFEALVELAGNLRLIGLAGAERTTLEYLRHRFERLAIAGDPRSASPTDKAANTRRKVELAFLYAPAMIRLVEIWMSSGRQNDLKAAAALLDEIERASHERIRLEWQHGSERAILILRQLDPALKGLVSHRLRLMSLDAGRAESHARALLRAIQFSSAGETALALHVTSKKRLVSSADAISAMEERDSAASRETLLRGIGEIIWADDSEALKQEIERVKVRKDSAQTRLSALLPVSEDMASIDPVDLDAVTAKLSADEAVVLITLSTDGVTGLLLRASFKPLAWHVDVAPSDLAAHIASVRRGSEIVGGRLPRFPVGDAAEIFEMLFGPVSKHIVSAKRLIIVPDATLQAVPFSVLLTSKPQLEPSGPAEFRDKSFHWLARGSAITILPSVHALVTQRSEALASKATSPFMGIGNPRLAGAPGSVRSLDFETLFARGALADVALLRSLAALPETEQELHTIGSALGAGPGDVILGKNATEAAIKAKDLSKYRVLAFATHGLAAGQIAGNSEPGLVMTPPATPTELDDGLLTMSEIMSLRLDADLVILSACSTATSDGRPRAEGLSGLARAFFTAGARGLIVTHWAIPSASSAGITTGMIAERRRDPSLDWAQALQRALVDMMDSEGDPSNAHPANWGAFVVVGGLAGAIDRDAAMDMPSLPAFAPEGWTAMMQTHVATPPAKPAKADPSSDPESASSKTAAPAVRSQAAARPSEGRPRLSGTLFGVSLNDVETNANGRMASGVVITRVLQGSPADRAGLLPGDSLTGVLNESSGATPRALSSPILVDFFKSQRPGDQVRVWISRNGSPLQAVVTMESW